MAYDNSNKLKHGMDGTGDGKWGAPPYGGIREEVKLELSHKRRQEDREICQDGLTEYYEELEGQMTLNEFDLIKPGGSEEYE